MAAINFPNSPTLNQEFQYNNITWKWDGSVWVKLGVYGPQGFQGIQGFQGGGGTGSGSYTASLAAAPSNGATLTLARSNETYITTQLTSSNSFTIGLDTQSSGFVNEYILIFKTGASVPTLTQPSGIVWRGQTPIIGINETWTIVYEYVQVSNTPTWEIYGTGIKNV